MAKSQFLADALKTFLFSLSQGMGAAAQAPGRRGTNLGMAAAIGAPMQLQEMERQRQLQEEDRKMRIEAAKAAAQRGEIENAVAIINTVSKTQGPVTTVPVPKPVATPAPIGTLGGGTYQPESQFGGMGQVSAPAPPPPVNLPGYGPVVPDTLGMAAVREGALARQQAQMEQEFASPPGFEPFNTPGGTINKNAPRGGFLPGTEPPPPEPDVNPALVAAILQDPARYHDLPPTLQAAVLPELTRQNVKIPPKPVDPTVQAIRDNTETLQRMQLASGGLTQSQVAGEVNTLRGQWTKLIEPTILRREAIAKIDVGLDALKRGNRNAATQTLILAFNKLQDEGSVVREGEYFRSETGSPIFDRIQASIQRLSEGGTNISDEELRKLGAEAKNIANAINAEREKELANSRVAIEESLKAYKIPATRVFGNSTIGKTPSVGDTKTFPNGKKGRWDGQGWIEIK